MIKRILFLTLLGSAVVLPAGAQRLIPPAQIPNSSGPEIIVPVQSNDSYRVIQLEETVRQLNGKVEELNFLLLQLQEKFRKMEEDNEGRFQELEDKHSGLTDKTEDVAGISGETRLGKPEPSGETISPDVKTDAKKSSQDEIASRAPRALGTLTFNKDGNVVGSDGIGSGNTTIFNPFKNGVEGSVEASVFGATPNAVFKVGKSSFDARKFPRAQQAFSAFLKAWPKDPRSGEARYYLGESLFWQKQYYQSAEIHLDTHNEYPEALTAADNLLGLGLSLAGLNQREVACATYAEVLKQYPDATARLGERIKDEQAAARC